jgi:hypothetical protein
MEASVDFTIAFDSPDPDEELAGEAAQSDQEHLRFTATA